VRVDFANVFSSRWLGGHLEPAVIEAADMDQLKENPAPKMRRVEKDQGRNCDVL
jgi:hypothetical protein